MITVVCGPPGSGKTTYVKKQMRWGDLIVDLDTILAAISGLDVYEKPETLLSLSLDVKDFLIERSRRGPFANAWIISGAPKIRERDKYRFQLNAKIVVLETSYFECWRRIANDPRRKQKAQQWEPLIKKWWDNYERCEADTIIRE